MKGYTMSKQNKGDKLIPVSTTRIDPVIVPEHKVESPTTGDCAIDQQARLVDIRTYRQIFEEGMASGAFDDCANPAQVNKMIGEIKGSGKPCVYMVSEVAHQWVRTDDPAGWVRKTEAELLANPFVAGVGHARVKNSAILDPIEEAALKEQAMALAVLADNAAIAPLLAAINAKLKTHETALAHEAISQDRIRQRTITLEAIKRMMVANVGKRFTITVYANGIVSDPVIE
jgi:hypothetical protein